MGLLSKTVLDRVLSNPCYVAKAFSLFIHAARRLMAVDGFRSSAPNGHARPSSLNSLHGFVTLNPSDVGASNVNSVDSKRLLHANARSALRDSLVR